MEEANDHYYECPREYEESKDGKKQLTLFLAGGITGCVDWQKEVLAPLLSQCPSLRVFNPRRAKWDASDKSLSAQQIKWEHDHLRKASAILFWFPHETLCPISLYELGAWSMKNDRPLFVGCHPEYQRKLDVEIQTGLVRPEIAVRDNLEALVQDVVGWYQGESSSQSK
ncbi:Nucleoside 2-deoxyribosyltransferase [Balamuthia mandrillaris]